MKISMTGGIIYTVSTKSIPDDIPTERKGIYKDAMAVWILLWFSVAYGYV